MKRKLTDSEAGAVTGGTVISCTAEQDAKINNDICPLCGGSLHQYKHGVSQFSKCRNPSCGKIFTLDYKDHWVWDNGEDDGC